jgi:hypothetical protein
MGESPAPCAFAPCSHDAVETLRLVVDGEEVTVSTCRRHACWLRAYAEEDAAVQLEPPA